MSEEKGKMTAKQRFKLKQFIKDLDDFQGRGTELVSVYVPEGYDINKIIQHLSQEQGTATNIKSTSTRKNVIDALERMIQHLRLYKHTPKNGLVAFSGNVAEREGQSDVQVWSIEPPVPLNQRLYRCDKQFILDPLKDLAEDKDIFGMVVLDKREATIAVLKGKTIIPITSTHSAVPGKTRAGGQCLDPETLVLCAGGEIKPIKDIVVGDSVLSLDNNKKLSASTVIDTWNSIKHKQYRIKTKNPVMEIRCSKDHLLYAGYPSPSWVAAEDLQKGHYLYFPEKTPISPAWVLLQANLPKRVLLTDQGLSLMKLARNKLHLTQKKFAEQLGSKQSLISRYERGTLTIPLNTFEKIQSHLQVSLLHECEIFQKSHFPSLLTPGFSQLLGYVLGDGYFDKTIIGCYEEKEAVARVYAHLIKEHFGCSVSFAFRADKNYFSVRSCIGESMKLLQEQFPELLKNEIPLKVCLSNQSVVASFLRGLFDAQGYVDSKRGIGLGMNNKSVIQKVQLLLLRFGIISSIHTYDNRKNPYNNNMRFTISITDKESLQIFARGIHFTAQEKKLLLDECVAKQSSTSFSRMISTPASTFRETVYSQEENLERFSKVSDYFTDMRMISKPIFATSVLPHTYVETRQQAIQALQDQLLPTQIVSIEVEKGKFSFVDISVETENFIAGGLVVHNSAARFERLRDGAAKDFYRKVGEYVKKEFYDHKDLRGILLGGPGHTKEEFLEQAQMPENLKEKFIAIKDLSYTGEFGLQELLEKCEDVLAAEEVMDEKLTMQRFFKELSTDSGLASYGVDEVMRVTKLGAVEILLLSEKLADNVIGDFEAEAQTVGTEVQIISVETREGSQLKELGGAAAILRYPIEF